jgi:hypothetical protein
MECAVCYEDCAQACKLICGHVFCTGCVKDWYKKGNGSETGCPMCRRPLYFRGFSKTREEWDEEAWEIRCAEAYSEAIDECIEDALDFASNFGPKMARRILLSVREDLCDIERTYNFLKAENYGSDDIGYVLMETDEYFSDRHLNRVRWVDEPRKEFATKYPGFGTGSARVGSRCRALEDECATFSFVIFV